MAVYSQPAGARFRRTDVDADTLGIELGQQFVEFDVLLGFTLTFIGPFVKVFGVCTRNIETAGCRLGYGRKRSYAKSAASSPAE